MNEKESIDVTIARELNLPPDAIRSARMAWNDNRQMKAVFAHRFEEMLRERRNALESCKPEELTGKQAEVRMLNLLKTTLMKRET